jgi:GT2 family glycosyltransferase
MLEEIGFFDEDFFILQEDTDLNFRAQLAGWKALYVPSAVVFHKVRSTIGHMSDTAIYYSLRNSELVRIKNVPFRIFLRCFPFYVIGVLLEFVYFAVKHGKLKLYIKAKLDAAKVLPRMLGKRKRIMTGKKVDDRYLYELLTPFYEKKYFIAKLKKFNS